MLTADELEALRKKTKENAEYFRQHFGRAKTQLEIDRERAGDEWWDNYLRQMRDEEAKESKD